MKRDRKDELSTERCRRGLLHQEKTSTGLLPMDLQMFNNENNHQRLGVPHGS